MNPCHQSADPRRNLKVEGTKPGWRLISWDLHCQKRLCSLRQFYALAARCKGTPGYRICCISFNSSVVLV